MRCNFVTFVGRAACCAAIALLAVQGALADELRSFTKNKTFDEMTAAEHTAARTEGRTRKLKVLRVCADPGNMPMSNRNGEGFQNKIAKVIADDLGANLSFFWRPYHERGLTRETFQNDECDILMDMPVALQALLTTEPIYRTTYVFAYRSDRGLDIKSLDDPVLETLKIGVFQHSGLREALERRGRKNLDLHIISYESDLKPEEQPWQQVQRVVDGKLDVAGVWGPFAGWFKTMKGAPIVLQPVNKMDHQVPMEFELAIGMQRNQVLLKYMIDWSLTRKRDEIGKILRDYGVPLVQCSKCAVDGDIDSHGSYYDRLRKVSQDRYLKEIAPLAATDKASDDQIVTQARVEAWLAEGADPTEEIENAVIANDAKRLAFLISKGADVKALDNQGTSPMHRAASNRRASLIPILVGAGADPNVRDNDGYTPLLAAINRNHVPTIEALAKSGADLEGGTKGGIVPLTWAIGDGKYYAAKALVDLGANINSRSGREEVTPLMVVATQLTAQTRQGHIAQGPAPVDIARLLIDRGADVNLVSKDGVSALMIAAGHNNAPLIGLLAAAGADLDAKSRQGKTATEIAVAAGNEAATGALQMVARQKARRASENPAGPGANN